MLHHFTHVFKQKIMLLAGIIGIAVAVGLVAAPAPSANAATRSCHVFTPTTDWYEAGFRATKEYVAPGSSECLDVNVRNIKNNDPAIAATDPDKYCASFKVAMYPSDKTKPVYYSKEKRVCSKDPSSASTTNGPVKALATWVYDGTRYRVLSKVTNIHATISYQIVD